MKLRWQVRTHQDTRAVATEVAELLAFGDVLALSGDLGAGKTTFVKHLVGALGGDQQAVTSPTFSLIDEHPLPDGLFVHADLYRINDASDLQNTGLLEYFGADDCIVVVEWPSKGGGVATMATAELAIALDGDVRNFVFTRAGTRN
jgi:tRNA threonylcarbamoyl adenosine modification protein YjeE